jgi:hypothetical protein
VTAADQPVGLMLDKSILQRPESRRNLLTYSEAFDNAYWTKTAQLAKDSIAPDGSLSAWTITDSSAAVQQGVNTAASVPGLTANAPYTFSLYIKKTTNVSYFMIIRVPSLYDVYVDFNTNTGAYAINVGSVAVESVGDYWRVSIRAWAAANKTLSPLIYPAASPAWPRPGGPDAAVTGSQVIWGAQIEAGPTATTYQKVTDYWTPGNHASQSTDAKRPMLRTDGRLWWLDYDGIDDVLNIAAAVAPGSSTLVDNRVSALTITTGVNVPASYALPANDAYGYLIKPPALSIDETAKLTRYFNVKAGR